MYLFANITPRLWRHIISEKTDNEYGIPFYKINIKQFIYNKRLTYFEICV